MASFRDLYVLLSMYPAPIEMGQRQMPKVGEYLAKANLLSTGLMFRLTNKMPVRQAGIIG